MRKVKRRRRGGVAWRAILERCSASGLSAPVFCAREGISVQSFRRWRARLGREVGRTLESAAVADGQPAAGFIDLGEVRAGGAHFEVRLELGSGLVLSIARR